MGHHYHCRSWVTPAHQKCIPFMRMEGHTSPCDAYIAYVANQLPALQQVVEVQTGSSPCLLSLLQFGRVCCHLLKFAKLGQTEHQVHQGLLQFASVC